MLLRLRLIKVDVGLTVVWVDEFVAHSCVPVVLVPRVPVAVRLAPKVAFCAPLPAAFPGVDTNDFLILKGDAAGNPRKWLNREKIKLTLNSSHSTENKL